LIRAQILHRVSVVFAQRR